MISPFLEDLSFGSTLTSPIDVSLITKDYRGQARGYHVCRGNIIRLVLT